MKTLYSITITLSGKFSKPHRPVKDMDGNTITLDKGRKKRWVQHFEELLNRAAPHRPPNVMPAEEDLPVDCNAPT